MQKKFVSIVLKPIRSSLQLNFMFFKFCFKVSEINFRFVAPLDESDTIFCAKGFLPLVSFFIF